MDPSRLLIKDLEPENSSAAPPSQCGSTASVDAKGMHVCKVTLWAWRVCFTKMEGGGISMKLVCFLSLHSVKATVSQLTLSTKGEKRPSSASSDGNRGLIFSTLSPQFV